MKLYRDELLAPVDGLLSDALGERYGPISARVLLHDARERRAHLVDAKGATRTFSVTYLSRPMPPALRPVNAEIRAGRLIGEAFRDRGFAIRKNVIDVFVVECPPWLRAAFRARERYAWARTFEFHARNRSSGPLLYATLCEIFTPDFKPPVVTPTDVSWLGPSSAALRGVGLSKEAAWNQIRRFEDGRNVEGRFVDARVATLPLVFDIRRRVTSFLELSDQ